MVQSHRVGELEARLAQSEHENEQLKHTESNLRSQLSFIEEFKGGTAAGNIYRRGRKDQEKESCTQCAYDTINRNRLRSSVAL